MTTPEERIRLAWNELHPGLSLSQEQWIKFTLENNGQWKNDSKEFRLGYLARDAEAKGVATEEDPCGDWTKDDWRKCCEETEEKYIVTRKKLEGLLQLIRMAIKYGEYLERVKMALRAALAAYEN